MRKTARTILCCGIAAVLFLFGVNQNEAEAVFCTQNVGNEKITAHVFNDSVDCEETDGAKIQAVRNTSCIQQMVQKGITGRKELKICFFSIYAPDMSDNISETDGKADTSVSLDICHRVAVLNYIHDLDGKKRV